MKIYAITISGKVITLEVEPTNTISDVKSQIHEKEGLSPERQNLIYFAQILDDDKTLKDYSIPNDAKIALHFNRFDNEILINLPKSEEIAIQYDPIDTIKTIKEKIQEQKGFPIEQQHLFYHYCQLLDDNLISNYLLKKSSRIYLTITTRNGLIIFVNSIPFEVEPTDTIEELKNQIAERLSIPQKDQKLFFNFNELENEKKLEELSITINSIITLKTEPKNLIVTVALPTDERLEFEVEITEKIEDLKAKINDLKQYPIEQQHLIFEGNEMLDEKTLYDYQMMPFPTFDLIISSSEFIIVFVQTKELKMAFPFRKTDTVHDIKMAVHEKTGEKIDKIKLTLNDQEMIDENSIEDCSIFNGSVLELSIENGGEIKITVQPIIGKPMFFKISPSIHISKIKEKIAKLEATEIEKIKLFFNGKKLNNDSRVQDYLIPEDSVLKLDFERSAYDEIKVNLPKSEVLKFNIDRKSRIEDVKEKIKEMKEFPVEKQRLFLKTTELENMNTIQNYSNITGGKVNLVLLSGGSFIIFVKTKNDRYIPLEVKPTDTIDDIKVQVTKREKIPAEEQTLFYLNKKIENKNTLQDYGITNDRTIIELK